VGCRHAYYGDLIHLGRLSRIPSIPSIPVIILKDIGEPSQMPDLMPEVSSTSRHKKAQRNDIQRRWEIES
jgi:hypothetical protein